MVLVKSKLFWPSIKAQVSLVKTALLALLLAIVMHVTWNIMARRVHPKCDFLWWGILCHLILVAPIGLYGLFNEAILSGRLLLTLVISAAANSCYFLCLRQAYRYAPVNVFYPLVRSSPILIALWTILLFRQQSPGFVWLGIIISVTGLWLLALSVKEGDAKRAIPWSIVAVFCTSIYSLSDKYATASLLSFKSI